MGPYTGVEIYSTLKQDILDLKLVPGQRLSETELAASFEVSRTPVHDALAQLKAETLVVRYPQRGTFVSLLDWNFIQEIIFMRIQLDIAVFSSVVYCWQPDYEPAIVQNLERQRQLVSENNSSDSSDEFYVLSNEFHAAFYAVLNKRRLWDEVVTQQHDYVRYRKLLFKDKSIQIDMFREHETLFNLVCDKNIGAINRFILQHNSMNGVSFPEDLVQFESYFKKEKNSITF